MKVNYEDKMNMLTFEQENENEKVFCVVGTIYGDGESFCRFMTEKEIADESWYDSDEWSKDVFTMEIGETSTFGYWYYDKANIIVRVA